jgi:hypothetical protein
MATISLATLLVTTTKAAFYNMALGIARAVGLPVTSWQAGDPTRSLYHLESEALEALEARVVPMIASGFLDYATGQWLKVKAEQDFNVEVPEATFATTDVVLTNTGGGLYTGDDTAAGNLIFKNSTTGKTYRNTTGGTLAPGPGTTLTVTVEAEEAGADSTAAAGEIDEMVTQLLGVTCTNPEAATGTDEQDEETTRQQCRDKLGALSPDGPAEAYSYVARDSELTGVTGVTKVRTYPDSFTGEVIVYLAGPSGGVSEPTRAAVEDAIAEWATPLCITPTVLSATNSAVAVTYTLWLYTSVNKTSAEIEEEVEASLEALFASPTLNPIGGAIIPPATTGSLYQSLIESTIRETFDEAFRVSVSLPSGDTALSNGQVATLGTITATINLVSGP